MDKKMSSWITYKTDDDAGLSLIPNKPGVYVVFIPAYKKPIYIGSAINLRKRLMQHGFAKWCRYGNRCKTTFGLLSNVVIKIKMVKFDDGSWLSIEWCLIKRIRPIFNKQWNNDKRHILVST